MKSKKQAGVLSILYLSAILLMLLSLNTAVYAADAYDPLRVEIPYKHIYTTTDTAADSVFHYIVTAEDGAPLPDEAEETGSFSFDGVSGSGKQDGDVTVFELSGALTFHFTAPGVYEYQLRADKAEDSRKTNADRYTLETSTISVKIYIVNDIGDDLRLQMYTAEDDSGVKLKEIILDPSYKFSAEIPPKNSETVIVPEIVSTPETPSAPETIFPPETISAPAAEPAAQAGSAASSETVLTGDNSPVRQIAAMSVISAVCMIILLFILRKKGREEDA